MKAKKIIKKSYVGVLTIGASLGLGLLSFTGIYALVPILGLGIGAFALSVVYESEIYRKNIGHAFNKIIKPDYLRNRLSRELLLKLALDDHNKENQFILTYINQLRLIENNKHKRLLSEKARKEKYEEEKNLHKLEKQFAKCIFTPDDKLKDMCEKLSSEEQTEFDSICGLINEKENDFLKNVKAKHRRHQHAYRVAATASVLIAGIASFGFFLMLSSAIPLLPITIVISLVIGIANGFQIFNASTDIISKGTVQKFFLRVYNKYKQNKLKSALTLTAATIGVVFLASLLTVFVAGTWFAITSAVVAAPVALSVALFMGVSAFVFNIQNASQSLDSIIEFAGSTKHFFTQVWQKTKNACNSVLQTITGVSKEINKHAKKAKRKENWLQFVNPFRATYKVATFILQTTLFFAHLVSIAVTADRFPGVPAAVTTIVGFCCEFLEDLHYFTPGHGHHHHHDHHGHHHENADINHMIKHQLEGGCGHNHGNDIPAKLIRLSMNLTLIKPLSVLWDWGASQLGYAFAKLFNMEHKPRLHFIEAVNRAYPFVTEKEAKRQCANQKQESLKYYVAAVTIKPVQVVSRWLGSMFQEKDQSMSFKQFINKYYRMFDEEDFEPPPSYKSKNSSPAKKSDSTHRRVKSELGKIEFETREVSVTREIPQPEANQKLGGLSNFGILGGNNQRSAVGKEGDLKYNKSYHRSNLARSG